MASGDWKFIMVTVSVCVLFKKMFSSSSVYSVYMMLFNIRLHIGQVFVCDNFIIGINLPV